MAPTRRAASRSEVVRKNSDRTPARHGRRFPQIAPRQRVRDDLGPRSLFEDASGGRALFSGNGELRFPVHRWLKGVGFVDLGNVYETVGDSAS